MGNDSTIKIYLEINDLLDKCSRNPIIDEYRTRADRIASEQSAAIHELKILHRRIEEISLISDDQLNLMDIHNLKDELVKQYCKFRANDEQLQQIFAAINALIVSAERMMLADLLEETKSVLTNIKR